MNNTSLPGYDSWRTTEPPTRPDRVPAHYRVTIELTVDAMLPPADAELLATKMAASLLRTLRTQFWYPEVTDVVNAIVVDIDELD